MDFGTSRSLRIRLDCFIDRTNFATETFKLAEKNVETLSVVPD